MRHPHVAGRRYSFVCALLLAVAAATSARGEAPWAFGAQPLSDTLVSMWLGDESANELKPGVLVYFRGEPGWHARAWRTSASDPLDPESAHSYALISDTLTLTLGVAQDRKTVTVQDDEFSATGPNVFLVVVTKDGSEVSCVRPLGRFKLDRTNRRIPLSVSAQSDHPRLAKKLKRTGCK